jgi:predicted transcriptional regulator
MKTAMLARVLERVEAWPPEVQDELAKIAIEIEAGMSGREYEPTPEELAGVDRGLRAADEGRFATDEEVEAVFAKFRRR